MRLLKTFQGCDFDVECRPGARNYIQDALSRRSDYKKAPIPRLSTKSSKSTPLPPPQPPAPSPLGSDEYSALPLASGVQGDEWIDSLGQGYKVCPYLRMC